MIFLQLFISYLKIGFFGFGGGYAMLSLIQNEVVVQHAWLTNAEFADIVAISQITPGPIAINSATYVGYSVGIEAGSPWFGLLGAFIATFAVCLPSLTLMLLLTRFFLKLHNNPLVEGAMKGMRPVVIGMIASAALLLIAPPQLRAGRPELHRRLELGALRRRLHRLAAQGEPHSAHHPLGRGRHPHLLRLLSRRTPPDTTEKGSSRRIGRSLSFPSSRSAGTPPSGAAQRTKR